MNFRSGFVSIVGRPNVGKSSLLNALLDTKISIVSPVPQTTRYKIRGVMHTHNAQVVFVDTPGMHALKEELAARLNEVTLSAIDGAELLLYVTDVTRHVGKEEQDIMHLVLASRIPVIMAFNKIDRGTKCLSEYTDAWNQQLAGFPAAKDPVRYYMPVSAETGKNISRLREAVIGLMPEHPPFYEPQTVTDFPLKFRIADTIREKLFLSLKEELPHSVAVIIEGIEDKRRLCRVSASIYANTDSQKAILIGKNGAFLKEAGTAARKDLEKMLKKKVYLDLRVSVLKNWQEKPRVLMELGYTL
ncbi:MAG: GTPase Era [Candidatus Omnitrophica bacterium]|nr:GTPase Era [Candidatus Omnitrophota bacterium]